MKKLIVRVLLSLHFRIEDLLEWMQAVEPTPGETEINYGMIRSARSEDLAALVYLGEFDDAELAEIYHEARVRKDAMILQALKSTTK